MTQIQDIRISGFKGIDELEVETGDFTVITGKNNTGKTSLLESIDLLFNPKNIADFGEQVGSLINAKHDTCSISCQYQPDPQASLGDFESDGDNAGLSNTETREVGLRYPKSDELIDLFVNSILDVISNSPKSGHYINRFQRQKLEKNESEKVSNTLTETLRDVITGLSERDISSKIDGNAIIVSVDGEEYPFIYLGEYYDDVRSDIIDEAKDRVIEDLQSEGLDELIENPDYLTRALHDKLVPRFGSGRFVGEKPPEIEGVKLLSDSIPLSKGDINMDKQNAAIRLSNIEEYMKENNIAEDLVTLSLDQLVFEEDGEKYQVPYNFMGSGFQAITGLLWELSDQSHKGDILLLEEAETHMHPGYVGKLVYRLVEIAMSKGIQVFATTHNIDFIKAFFSENLKDGENSYLEDEFKLLQLSEPVEQVYDYSQAQRHTEELQLDLRGL